MGESFSWPASLGHDRSNMGCDLGRGVAIKRSVGLDKSHGSRLFGPHILHRRKFDRVKRAHFSSKYPTTRRWPSKSRRFQAFHDVLLYYAPIDGTFNVLRDEPTESTVKTWGTKKQNAKVVDGKRIASESTDDESQGPAMGDVWQLPVLAPSGNERKDGSKYPTQKPSSLLERVILSSSNFGDVLLDPGAGSGTSLIVARKLGRGFVGIDRSDVAIAACESRLGILASSDACDLKKSP
jgi:DNA modification methylase